MSMVDIDPENLADEENFSGLMPFLADAVKKRIIEDDVDGLRIIESEVRNLAQQLVIFADTIEIRKKEYKRIKNKMRDLEEQARLQQQTIEALRSNMLAEFGISEDDGDVDLSIPEFQDTSLDADLDVSDDDLLSYYSDGKDLSVFNFDDDDGDDDLLADLGFGYVDDVAGDYATNTPSNTGSVGTTNSNLSATGMMIPDFEDDFDLAGPSSSGDDMFSTSSTTQTPANANASSSSSGFDPYHFGGNQSSGGNGGGSSPFSDGSNGVGAPFVAANSNTNTSTTSFEQISPFSPASMFSDDDDEDNEYVETDSIENIYAEDDEYKKQLAHEKALLSQKSQNRVYSDEQTTVNNNMVDDDALDDDDGDSEADGSKAPLVQGMSLSGFTSQIVLNENDGLDDGSNSDDYDDIIDENFFAI